jgi:erythromycin esterase-like protein
MFRSYRVGTLAAFLLTIASVALAGSGEPPKSEEVKWLVEHAIPFDTPEAASGFDDLEPLRTVVGDARIVGLGECTHGTSEVFRFKHRLVEFLAAEMDFTVFSIEANMPEAYRLNDYVLGGEGEPETLIGGMYFWTWSTEEVLAMVEWMREFNASGKGRIQFTGFDMQTPDVAMGIVTDFLEGVDAPTAKKVGGRYFRMKTARPKSGTFGMATWTFPVEAVRGRRLVYSGAIKTEDVQNGRAGLWWRVDSAQRKVLTFDNMMNRGPKGTTDWTEYTIEIDVPESAANINFGVIMQGQGKAWFDALKVELDGEVYTDPDEFDFDFEEPGIRGYYASNDGVYRTTLDDGVARTGNQSLRIESIETAESSDPDAVQAQEAMQWAYEVVDQLESSRDRYLERAPAGEVDWAIQNARVVEQCMRSRAGNAFLVREYSMAKNIAWIMEQNPGAKIVVWAHNGHINRDMGRMGAHLARDFGDAYLPIGFAARSGRYYAVGDKGMGDHDLHEPPPGSIESYFAATGKPRLILDLRPAEQGSRESGWLTEKRQLRSIGAKAMEQQFHTKTVTESFDVLIYFDETTAAVQLGSQPGN